MIDKEAVLERIRDRRVFLAELDAFNNPEGLPHRLRVPCVGGPLHGAAAFVPRPAPDRYLIPPSRMGLDGEGRYELHIGRVHGPAPHPSKAIPQVHYRWQA